MAERPRSHHRVPDADLPNAPSPALICRSTAPGSGIRGTPTLTIRAEMEQRNRGVEQGRIRRELGSSLDHYGRRALAGHDPNDRRYDRKLAQRIKKMPLEELGELLNGDARTRAVNPLALVARPLGQTPFSIPLHGSLSEKPLGPNTAKQRRCNRGKFAQRCRGSQPDCRSDIEQSKGR